MQFIPRKQRSSVIQREKIIIYLDISSEVLPNKKVVKVLNQFVKSKYENNPHHIFEIFYFNKNSEPILHDNLMNEQEVRQAINDGLKNSKSTKNYFENGLFFCLSGIASSFLSQAITFRVVVISDLPSEKNSEYIDALMNLVETVRTFPTIIDIIRIGQGNRFKDDVKLRIISTITKGELRYAKNSKELNEALQSLLTNSFLQKTGLETQEKIDISNKKYFEDLSVNLVYAKLSSKKEEVCQICQKEICNFCNSVDDPRLMCPSCGYIMHECCSALYSWNFNIGLKNIFRCPGCGILIKLDEKLVYIINGQDLMSKKEDKGKKTEDTVENIVSKESFEVNSQQKMAESISTHPKSKNNQRLTSLRDPHKRNKARRSMICPVCSSFLKKDMKKCPTCGCPIN